MERVLVLGKNQDGWAKESQRKLISIISTMARILDVNFRSG